MNTVRMPKPSHPKRNAVVTVLTAVLVGFSTPIFGQSDLEQQIEALQKQLDKLKEEVRAQQTGAGDSSGTTDGAGSAQQQGDELTAVAQTDASSALTKGRSVALALPRAGVQGSPNPLQDDRRYLTGADLLDATFPGSTPVLDTNMRFKIGGYAKLDFIQDLDFVGDRFEFELATIPVEGTPEAALDGRTTVHAKQTRINFDFRSKAHNQSRNQDFPLQAFLEIDFFDDREEFELQPRLRHAYGVVGRFLAGQTWSTSLDLEALPGTIDFAAGDALYGDRLAVIRWSDRLGDTLTWAVALEDPVTEIDNPLGLEGEDRPELPNLAGRVRWTKGGSHFQVGADLFQLDWQGGDTGPSDTSVGWGVNLTGRVLLGGSSNNAIMGGASFGDGSAHRVVVLSGAGNNDAVITPTGLDVLSHWQAYIGYSHYWTKSLNSTFSTAWTELDNSDSQLDDAIHRAGSFHANLIWFPYKLASTGIEVMWGMRENKDGADGDAWRIQYMAKWKFN